MSDESTRRHTMSGHPTRISGQRHRQELDEQQCLDLLASVRYGRVMFTVRGLPAIRPVNHLIDEGRIIVRTRLAAKVAATLTVADDIVVAYQADQLDQDYRLGWSVVATGIACPITDADQATRHTERLDAWLDPAVDTMISIHPQILTGFRLTTA
ncbi:pyridoxamine 5'-phosphate oxidase family protein [Phytohabitans rumicis]|uniref:Pyridoxamine 5'-phosphate oxidase n=1 Tax=Phytohabitans rumicis TaxID=1076125 RepID=A0A6V8LA26_9ACTN|nr:pyridoxamine 5'-phosphate oxidase family protein [Phytohabitans rumicis]GFJ93194.1 hypothetical protein Prum_068360 [Phytohabitans rumicis]